MYCQKCRATLKVGNPSEVLNPAAFDLLVGSANKQQRSQVASGQNFPHDRKDLFDRTTQKAKSPLYRRTIPPPKIEDGVYGDERTPSQSHLSNPVMSFIEITESQIVPPEKTRTPAPEKSAKNDTKAKGGEDEEEALSWHMKRQERLFSILSSRSDIDLPICAECASMLVSHLNARLASATRDKDLYAAFLKQLQQTSLQTETDRARQLDDLVKEEKQRFQELLRLEEEKQSLEAELAALEKESKELDLEEERFWQSRNTFDDNLYSLQTELNALQEKYNHDQKQLERLQRTNVYNDTFCIGHDGYFGTINGLRLGRLSTHNVEWAEINAAWGQTLLLLATVAERIGFQFQGYRLRPLGSTSKIEKLEWPQQPSEVGGQRSSALPAPKVTQLDLFSSGDTPLGRVFNHHRFDAGMVAFLDCLNQIGKYVEKASGPSVSAPKASKTGAMVLPYSINGDKIEHVSIRLGAGFSQDENFTKACKYTLTCCKFLLAHVSNLEGLKGA